jgi:hypothetical protein
MQAVGDIISYFFPIILIVTLKRAKKSNWGKIYDIFSSCVFIFSPCVFIFSPCVFFSLLGHAINCSTFTGGVLGKNILSLGVNVFPRCQCFPPVSMFFPRPRCMVFTFPYFLDSFLDMSLRRNNIIFFPWSSFFPTCDGKTCKKIMGERKFPYFSP